MASNNTKVDPRTGVIREGRLPKKQPSVQLPPVILPTPQTDPQQDKKFEILKSDPTLLEKLDAIIDLLSKTMNGGAATTQAPSARAVPFSITLDESVLDVGHQESSLLEKGTESSTAASSIVNEEENLGAAKERLKKLKGRKGK